MKKRTKKTRTKPRGRPCAVPLCPNRSSEGKFVGEVCRACATAPYELLLFNEAGEVLVSGKVTRGRYREVVERTGYAVRFEVRQTPRSGTVGLPTDPRARGFLNLHIPTNSLVAGSHTVEINLRKGSR